MQVYWQENRECEGLSRNLVSIVRRDKHLCELRCGHAPRTAVCHGGAACTTSAPGLREDKPAAQRRAASTASDFAEP